MEKLQEEKLTGPQKEQRMKKLENRRNGEKSI
jgi:hypothetical protein